MSGKFAGMAVDKPNGILLVGEEGPCEAFRAAFVEAAPGYGERVRIRLGDVDAYAIGWIGRDKALTGEYEDTHEMVPNYTQMAEAEAKWLAKQR